MANELGYTEHELQEGADKSALWQCLAKSREDAKMRPLTQFGQFRHALPEISPEISSSASGNFVERFRRAFRRAFRHPPGEISSRFGGDFVTPASQPASQQLAGHAGASQPAMQQPASHQLASHVRASQPSIQQAASSQQLIESLESAKQRPTHTATWSIDHGRRHLEKNLNDETA